MTSVPHPGPRDLALTADDVPRLAVAVLQRLALDLGLPAERADAERALAAGAVRVWLRAAGVDDPERLERLFEARASRRGQG